MRRAIGIAAACVLASLAVGAQAVPAAAPVDGTLYGIGFPSSIMSIDPASGALSTIVSLAGVGPNALPQAIAADAKSGLDALVLTCVSCPNPKAGGGPVFFQIAVVNPATGSVSASPILQQPIAPSIAVDPKTHAVWGVADCATTICSASTVVRIDPSTGAETNVATLPAAVFAEAVAFAPKTDILYLLTFAGQLFEVNTAKGTIVTGPALGPNITGMAVDASDGELFVTTGTLQQQQVERIDPETGQSTILATLNGIGLSSPAIDPKSHTLFAISTVQLQTLTAGEVLSLNDRTGSATIGQPTNAARSPLAFLHD